MTIITLLKWKWNYSSAGRHEHRRHSAQRYQDSRSGRLKHAARTACWRRRERQRQRCLCPF